MRGAWAILLLLFMMTPAFAQAPARVPPPLSEEDLAEYFTFGDPSPWSCLLAVLPTAVIAHGLELKEFVRSDEFAALRKRVGDARAVDAIFVRSMQLTDNNTGIALLISAAATFDHDVVGVKNPVFSIYFPLTSESDDDFRLRRSRLPAHFYDDSPRGAAGDRDKLQHFFGSAFLSYALGSTDAAGRFGDFVERGEDAFIIGGERDERDYRANRQGQLFASALEEDNHRYPSEFFRAVIAADSINKGDH